MTDDRSGADRCVPADGEVPQDRRVAAYCRAAAHKGRHHLPVRLARQLTVTVYRPRVAVVHEDDAVADEHAVLDRHPGADEGVGFDLAAPADGDPRLDLDEGADLGPGADGAAIQVDEVWMMQHDLGSKTHV